MSKKTDSAPASLQVWDVPVRLLHWGMVAAVAISWWSSDDNGPLHENTGYVVIALLAARLAWGWCGSHYARFAQFVRPAATTLAYTRAAVAGRAPRYIGHNPLGGWMVVALLGNLTLLGASGWLYTTDMFWGYGWLAKLHKYLGWCLQALIALHVCGMLWTCRKQRENLVQAMVTGRKSAAQPGDVI